MVKRSLQTLFIFIASLLWHFNASAQIADEGFSYAQKNQTIALAKLGDAEALFQLGLSHLNGSNSVQNDTLANRFFHYAAEKGHAEAKAYLVSATGTEAPKEIKPVKNIKRVKAEPNSISARAQKRRDRRAAKRRDRKATRAKQAKAKPVIIESEVPNKEKILAAVVDLTDTVSQPIDSDETNIGISSFAEETQTIKLASNSSETTLTAHIARPEYISAPEILTKSTRKPLSLWFVLGLLMGLGPIYLIALRLLKKQSVSPKDFSKNAYLVYNRDQGQWCEHFSSTPKE